MMDYRINLSKLISAPLARWSAHYKPKFGSTESIYPNWLCHFLSKTTSISIWFDDAPPTISAQLIDNAVQHIAFQTPDCYTDQCL